MVKRILGRFLLLTLILICKSDNSCNWDPFKCQLRNENCIIGPNLENGSDCRKKKWDKKRGETFNITVRFKNKKEESCEVCCCHLIKANVTPYQNSCTNCISLWSNTLETGALIFSGSRAVMKKAIKKNLSQNITVKDDPPQSVTLCPDKKRRKCKLHPSMNDDWVIVDAENSWSDYFEKSIMNGFITVKELKDLIDFKVALQRKDKGLISIHFLSISIGKKDNNAECVSCLESDEFTTLPLLSSSEPSAETQSINDANTKAIYFSSTSTSQIFTVPTSSSSTSQTRGSSSSNSQTTMTPAMITSNFPSTNSPETKSLDSFDGHSLKTLNIQDTLEQKNLEKELNSTGNETDKRMSVTAKFVEKYDHLRGDNLAVAVKELSKVSTDNKINENITKDFTKVVDHVVSTKNIESWENLSPKKIHPSDIMNATESYLEEATRHMEDGEKNKAIKKRNLNMHYGSVQKQKAYILQSYKVSLRVRVNIPPQILQTARSPIIRYSFVYYRSLSLLMKRLATTWNEKKSQSERLNSPILSISIYPQLRYPLKKNIVFTLDHNKRSSSQLVCAYWNFTCESQKTDPCGKWETEGCHVVSQNQSCTTCSCNHLTNFALLMTIHSRVVDNDFTRIISLISGCLSSLFVLITIACYAVLWPNITQNPVNRSRAIILMNLCVALLLANIIFLAGSHQYENKVACKAISALLHFFYLAVFFSMLMEGIDMFITVILVFSKKIKAKWFILGTWIFPLLIVGISLLVKFDDYVDKNHCWISVHGGLRWAFIGPAFSIIFINTIILITVISRMLRTREMMQKTIRERVRTGARGITLLSPILGFTWITGFFLLNKLYIFQYIFIICHSLQGIFIFLLHCLFSRQMREGFCQWLHKKSYFNELSNSTLKCAGLDQTNVTRTMSTAQSLDELDSDQNKLSEFQPRKSVDFLIPGK